jgi:ankyrin repeat protein
MMNSLYDVCSYGSISDVKEFFESSAMTDIVNYRDYHGHTPFMLAVNQNNLKTSKYIASLPTFNKDSINWTNKYGESILHNVCITGNLDAIIYLGTYDNLDVNIINKSGYTPFVLVATIGNFPHFLKIIASLRGFNPNVITSLRTSQLAFCCMYDSLEGVKILLSKNGTQHLNVKDNINGETPLMYAVSRNNIMIIQELLKQHNLIIPDDVELYKQFEIMDEVKQLIDDFRVIPKDVRHRLELGNLLNVYRLIVYTSDGYFVIKNGSENFMRFIKIMLKLPLELQMVMINRMNGSTKDIIKGAIFDHNIEAFEKKYLTPTLWETFKIYFTK